LIKILLIILLLWPGSAAAKTLDLSMREKKPLIEHKILLPNEIWVDTKPVVYKKKSKKLSRRGNKTLIFLFVPLALPLHTLVHEGSHAAMAEMLGYGVTGFYPYPHYYDEKFYFGRVTTSVENPSGTEQLLFSLAPALVDISMFSVSDALLSTKIVDIHSIAGMALYIFGIIAPLIDFSVGYLEGSDWDNARAVSSKTSVTINIVGAAFMAAGIYRALTHTVRLFK
jgi:hypothetical protein